MNDSIEVLYLVSGLVLPLFYAPQILRFRKDGTLLASYSMSKAACQFLLRLPALLFALLVVQNTYMDWVLSLDIAGRALELAAATVALRRQGIPWGEISRRLLPSIDRLSAPQPADAPAR